MKTEVYKRVIKNIRTAIEKSGLKQKAVAERAGLTDRQLSDILCFRKRLSTEDIPNICTAIGAEPNDIFYMAS